MKRFTDTEKWRDPWFRKLGSLEKNFWGYICDNCDNAGIWRPDLEMAEFCIGLKIEPAKILDAFSGRILVLPDGYWLIIKFVEFQYGELNPDCRPHQQVLGILKRHGLGYAKGIYTLKDRIRIGSGSDQGGVGGDENAPELPRGFPKNEDEAIGCIGNVGCDREFALKTWNLARSRGGKDHKEIAIVSWPHFLKSQWDFERDRRNKPALGNGHGSVPAGIQLREIDEQISRHPANRDSAAYNGKCTELDKASLRALRTKRNDLSRQIANA